MNKEEALAFSDALGILSSMGPSYRTEALQIAKLDSQGRVNVDPALDPEIQGETDDPGRNRKIRLNPELFNLSPARVTETWSDERKATTRHKNAVLLASILHHELHHWNRPPSAMSKNARALGFAAFEGPAYEAERTFFVDLVASEKDPVRRLNITAVARDREHQAIYNGDLSAPARFN